MFTQIVTHLRPEFEVLANLALVWDGTSAPTAKQRTYKPAPGFWDNLLNKRWDKVLFVRDVYVPRLRNCMGASSFLNTYSPKVLLDTYLCQQEKLYGDRAYRLLGYKSAATAPVPDSFSAGMDAFSAFLIQGMALSGMRLEIREGIAIEFYNTFKLEAQADFDRYASSPDPLHMFPESFIPRNAPSKAVLSDTKMQLEKLTDIQTYVPELLCNSSQGQSKSPDSSKEAIAVQSLMASLLKAHGGTTQNLLRQLSTALITLIEPDNKDDADMHTH